MTPRSSCPGGESTPLQGANLRLNYEINNVTDTALGNIARGKPSFCRSDRCLSYRPPGSLLESRGGSILARAEGQRTSRLVRAPSNRWQKARRKQCATSYARLRGRRSTRCARRSWSRYLDKSRNGGDCGAS